MPPLRHLALLLILFPFALPGQQPTTAQVLTRVHENFKAYLAALPNLIADEHLSAVMNSHDNSYSRLGTSTTYDSLFRLRRSIDPAQPDIFTESREILRQNSRPVTSQTLATPVLVRGAFSYAVSFISPSLTDCYSYKLDSTRRYKKQPVLILTYELRPKLPADLKCPVTERHTGRAFIDPATMQVLRIEQKRPEYPLGPSFTAIAADSGSTTTTAPPGSRNWAPPASTDTPNPNSPKLGSWSWSIDYAPVALNGKVFWLPATITSSIYTLSGPGLQWDFAATYSNYHLLYVTSGILPGYKPAKSQPKPAPNSIKK